MAGEIMTCGSYCNGKTHHIHSGFGMTEVSICPKFKSTEEAFKKRIDSLLERSTKAREEHARRRDQQAISLS